MFGLRNMYKPHPAVSTHNSRIVKSLFLVHFVTSLELLSQPYTYYYIYIDLFVSLILILFKYLDIDHRVQKPIMKLQILSLDDFFNQSDRFLTKKVVSKSLL